VTAPRWCHSKQLCEGPNFIVSINHCDLLVLRSVLAELLLFLRQTFETVVLVVLPYQTKYRVLLLGILFQVAEKRVMVNWLELLLFTLILLIFHLSQLFTETKLLDCWLLLFVPKLSPCLIREKTLRNDTLFLLFFLPLLSLLLSYFLFAQNPQLAFIDLLLFGFGELFLLFYDQQRNNVCDHLCRICFSSHLRPTVLAVTVVLIRALLFRRAWRFINSFFILWPTCLVTLLT